MKGLIITYAHSQKIKSIQQEFAKKGVQVSILRPKILFNMLKDKQITPPLTQYWDFALLFGAIRHNYMDIIKLFEHDNIPMFNSIDAIKKCNNKWLTYTMLKEVNIPQMESYITYKDAKINGLFDVLEDGETLVKKVVIKELHGQQGKQIYLCSSLSELYAVVNKLQNKRRAFMFQEFCATTKGRCARTMCIGGKCVGSYYKTQGNADWRINLAQGAGLQDWDCPSEFVDVSERAAKILGCDLCGIDIMFGANDEPIICEVNSDSSFRGFDQIGKIDIKNLYTDYVIKSVKDLQNKI